MYYYYRHDMYCPKCGEFYKELDQYWVDDFGERASMDAITRYFKYGYEHPETGGRYYAEEYGYPGNEW